MATRIGRLLIEALRDLDDEDRVELRALLDVPGDADQPGRPEVERLTCSEAAERAGCNVETIRRAIRRGELPAGMVGRSPRISPADLEQWLSAPSRSRPTSSAPRRARSQARGGLTKDSLLKLMEGGNEC